MKHSCRTEELETIEAALLHILQEENPLPPSRNFQRKEALSRILGNDCDDVYADDDSTLLTPCSLDAKDLDLVAKLLHQLQVLKADMVKKASMEHCNMNAEMHCSLEDYKKMVCDTAAAASEAAKAAAIAAENLETMKAKLIDSDIIHIGCNCEASTTGDKEEGKEEEAARGLPNQIKIVKSIERQNRITHWILGFMFITTAVWRFQAISYFLRFRKAFSNPFQSIGDFFSDGLKGQNEKPAIKTSLEKAQTVLPSLLHPEQTVEKASLDGSKESEGPMLSLDNLLSIKKSNSH